MSGRSTLAILSLAIVLAGAAAPGPSLENPAWFEPVEPLHVVGPIWYVGTRDLGAYLITTPHGHILIDGAMPRSAGLIEASIRKAGFKPEEIRLLLITHAHVDHVGTLAHFKKISGASLAVMAPDDALLRSGGRSDYLYAKVTSFHFPKVTADRVLKDGDTVTLGDVTLTARLTAGHTRGCTTWIMTADDGGRSYSVVFPGSTSINPGTRLVRKPSYPGIAGDYRRALDVLDSFQPDIFLPAHASFFDLEGKRERSKAEGVQAFVDPGGYRRRMADQRKNFEAQVAKETAPPGGTAAGSTAADGGIYEFEPGGSAPAPATRSISASNAATTESQR